MSVVCQEQFIREYEAHLKQLRLGGLKPKAIKACWCALRAVGVYFDGRTDDLFAQQLLAYFTDQLRINSWSAGKLDLYALKSYYTHELGYTLVYGSR